MTVRLCEVKTISIDHVNYGDISSYPPGADGLYIVTSSIAAGSAIALVLDGIVVMWASMTYSAQDLLGRIGGRMEQTIDPSVIAPRNGFMSENAVIKLLAVAQNPELIKDIDLFS